MFKSKRSAFRLSQPDQPGSTPKQCRQRIELLRHYIHKGSVGAELGVLKGSFIDYLLTTEPSKLYCVDPWYRLGPEWAWAIGEKSTLKAIQAVLEAFDEEILSGQLEPRVEFSQEFLSSIPDDHLDWIYIDTSHKYEQTCIELELSLRKVKSSGFIMGDDYNSNPAAQHSGVYRAVQEFRDAGRITLLIDGERRQFVAQRVQAAVSADATPAL